MELSNRLKFIISHIDKCESIIDVGSDHGYIPIYAVKNNLCNYAIASDINLGPVEKAKVNAKFEGVSDKVQVRLGAGLNTVRIGEVKGVVIAGMGGNLIRDILEEKIGMVESFEFLILQPAQNPEVLREYLYTGGYEIISEDLCVDEGIYYELFKVKRNRKTKIEMDRIFYEFSPLLLKGKNPLMKGYLNYKKEKYKKILSFIKEDSESALKRKKEIEDKIITIEKFIEEL